MENKSSGSLLKDLIIDYLDNTYDQKEKERILSYMEKYLLNLQRHGKHKGKA